MATLEGNIEKVTDYLLAIERAGTPYDWWREGDPALGAGPPAHAADGRAPRPEEVGAVFCLTGDTTVVSPPVEKSYRRLYSGEVVTIETAGGNKLTGTPNHPILTDKGWLPLKSLRKGVYVMSSPGFRQFAGAYPDHYNEPSSLEQMHRSLAYGGVIDRHPVTSFDFHGDGRDGEVEVAIPERVVRDGGVSVLFEQSLKFGLSHASPSDTALAVPGMPDQKVAGIGAFSRLVSGVHLREPLGGAEFGVLQALGFGDAAQENPGFFEPRLDRLAGDPEVGGYSPVGLSADLLANDGFGVEGQAVGRGASRPVSSPVQTSALADAAHLDTGSLEPVFDHVGGDAGASRDLPRGLPADVRPDKIVDVKVNAFSGHVYNLQTGPGHYVANGIVSHNCAGLGNLALRLIGRPVPKLHPYDGGTGAWRRAYGPKMVPFSLAAAREGDVAFRPFNWGGPQDQGHWAYVGPGGKIIQSFAWNGATVEPGVTSKYTVAESHDGGYYVYLLKAKDWLTPLPREEKPREEKPREEKPKDRPEGKPPPEVKPRPDKVVVETGGNGVGELFTAGQLSTIMENPDTGAMRKHRNALLPEMEKGDITTPERVAAFLAEIGHETARLATLEEYGHEGYFRSFLGSEWFYHGRGYIMLTWTSNYRAAGKALGLELVENPALVEQPEIAAKTAVWFWTEHGLNSYADRGDIRAISSIINTGRPDSGNINGLSDRLNLYERARKVLGIADRIRPNLVAVGQRDEEAAHAAALVFRRRGFFVTTTVGPQGVRAFDNVFSKEPVGTRQMIVVGGPALGALLPGSQRYVFNPYRPAESDYVGAAGESYEDTLDLLAGIMRDHAGKGAGAEFRAVLESRSPPRDGAREPARPLGGRHA